MFFDITIDKVKEYWDNRPCNLRHSPKEPGTKEYYDEVEQRKYFVEPHIIKFAEFEKWKNKRVLEIGCGIGTDTIQFARAGAYVTAIDLSEKSIELARKRAEIYGVSDKICFYQGNIEELKIEPPEPYDLIYSFGVLHHTPNPEKALKVIKKFMYEDTIFKLMVYYKFSWKVLWILFKYGKGAFWKLDKLIAQYSEAQTGCPVTYAYTKRSARILLRGFRILDCRVEHIFPYSIPEYKKYQYKKVWYFKWMPTKIFQWFESKLGWHLCITVASHS